MAALIRQANKRVRNKPKIKNKNERTHGKKEGEKREKTTTTHSEKREEACNVSEQRDKGLIHVIRVHDTTHLAVTTTRQSNRRSRTKKARFPLISLFYPHKKKNEKSR